NKGFENVEYLSSALVDMRMHLEPAKVRDVDAFERETLESLGMPRQMVMRHRLPHFGHLFSSDAYSAGYYSYLWADTLSADAFVAERERAAFAAGAKPLDGPVDVLVSVVVDADETRAVVREHSGRAPAFMMCSTIAPSDSEAIAADLAARGVAMLDAPVSGGP